MAPPVIYITIIAVYLTFGLCLPRIQLAILLLPLDCSCPKCITYHCVRAEIKIIVIVRIMSHTFFNDISLIRTVQ